MVVLPFCSAKLCSLVKKKGQTIFVSIMPMLWLPFQLSALLNKTQTNSIPQTRKPSVDAVQVLQKLHSCSQDTCLFVLHVVLAMRILVIHWVVLMEVLKALVEQEGMPALIHHLLEWPLARKMVCIVRVHSPFQTVQMC